ncbi:hypothetical protein NUACC21_39390 [Scytonema sp. NUACC21]
MPIGREGIRARLTERQKLPIGGERIRARLTERQKLPIGGERIRARLTERQEHRTVEGSNRRCQGEGVDECSHTLGRTPTCNCENDVRCVQLTYRISSTLGEYLLFGH